MKIQLMSDLHLEFYRYDGQSENAKKVMPVDDLYELFDLKPEVEVLVLAGDIVNAESASQQLLVDLLDLVKIPVVYIAGNHEYYEGNVYNVIENLRTALKGSPHVEFLDDETTVIGDTLFVGATLYTHIVNPIVQQQVSYCMNDFYRAKGLDIGWWNNKHFYGDKAITGGLNLARLHGIKKTVVVSHMSPSYKSCSEMFRGEAANAAYHNEYDEFLLDDMGPDLWVHGHVHTNFDYTIGKTRVVCNPRGYWQYCQIQNKAFNPALILEI